MSSSHVPPTVAEISAEDHGRIIAIADRWERIAKDAGRETDRLGLTLDLSAVHSRIGLRLDDLLAATAISFIHDIVGIRRHLDRTTGELRNCFLPRYARPSSSETENPYEVISATYTYTLHGIALAKAGSPKVCPREGCGGDARSAFEFIPVDARIRARASREEPYVFEGESTADWEGQDAILTDDGLPILQCDTCYTYFAHPDIEIDG